MNMNRQQERNSLLLYLIGTVVVGALIGYMAELLVAFLLAYIVFQYSRLQQLYRWAKSSEDDPTPFEDGLLGQIAEYIYQCKQQRLEQKDSVKYQLERFRKLIAVFPDGVVILSLTNEIQWFNAQASRLLVLKSGDTGQPINHLVRQPAFVGFLKNISDDSVMVMDAPVAETNFSAEKIEIRVLPYGGDERLLLIRDVTKVERANQMRKDFVSNASHELRTPLTVMKGYVEMLLASSSDENVALQKVDLQVIKMQTMIEELLALSQLEEGRVDNSLAAVGVQSLCDQIQMELEVVAEQNEQTLVFDVAVDSQIKGNRASLLTVLRNLVSNAINYSDKGAAIHVEWNLDKKGRGTLSVRDTGKGIAARHLGRLTERFYRVAENNSMHKTGTGLGLAIVKHELERHEARLVIDSVLGEGSRFQCVFPATRVEA